MLSPRPAVCGCREATVLTVAGNGKVMDDHDDVDQALKLIHAAGWSVGDTAFLTEVGVLVWLVSGRNGENVIRAEEPAQAAAWRAACDQARAVGMIPGWRVSEPGVG